MQARLGERVMCDPGGVAMVNEKALKAFRTALMVISNRSGNPLSVSTKLMVLEIVTRAVAKDRRRIDFDREIDF